MEYNHIPFGDTVQLFSTFLRLLKQTILFIFKTHFMILMSVCVCMTMTANASTDSDGDGLSDQYEESIGTEAYLSDTDGDGIKDGVEVGKNLSKPLNTDNDKRIDALDYDDDNDGLPTYLEGKGDKDNDGVANYLDKDSDNDGVTDGIEAGMLNRDSNMDGIDDAFDSKRVGAIDKNGDDIDDNVKLPDINKNGIVDFLESKFQNNPNKKIAEKPVIKQKPIKIAVKEKAKEEATKSKEKPTQIETVKNEANKAPEIKPNRYTDTDNDGLLDSQEVILGTNPRKRDSDGDKVSDAVEIGLDINSPQDSDRDGIIDALDPDDDNDTILTKFEDINQDSTAINDDTDEDGVPNYLDANDDGDNKLTKDEGGSKDSDNDGILDYLDKDDGHKDKAPEQIVKEAPKEPEVIVLFDGDEDALMNETDDMDALEESLEMANIDEQIETKETVKLDQQIETKKSYQSSKQAKVKSPWELF